MEEIEVLDENEPLDYKVKQKERKSPEKRKTKRKLRKGEKIFLIINILIIIGIIGFYAYRTVYYYKESHEIKINPILKDKLTSLSNIAYQNDGLYEDNGYFYYKGSNVNNYVYFLGRMFRIIDIKDGIKMIEDNTSTNLVWGMDTDFNDSIINKWLLSYLTTLKDYEFYLKEKNWCNEKIDVSNYSCNEKISSYVGLLSTNDYLQAGGKNSYLNNETYFWTINQDMDGKALFINNEGGINNLFNNINNYYSYGIRPVITLREDISIISGDGSENNPFVIEELGKAMLRDNSVGNYVKYNNQVFRILKIEEDGVTLILDGTLDVEKNYTDTIKYLNNEYLKEFNKDDLVKIKYSVSEYNYDNKYDFISDEKDSNYVTIPKIGDLFLNEYDEYWLNNINDSKLGLYYIVDENKMYFGDLKGNKHKLRPVIKLNSEMVVTDGIGTKEEPLVVGEEYVEEN
jgi:cell division protein FtsL